MKIAAASATAMLLTLTPWSRPAASEFLYKNPCIIEVFADHQPSVYTDCVVRSSMAQGAYHAIITLPDGRKFRIENAGPASYADPPSPGPDPSEIWFLNGAHARKAGTEAKPCYQNARVRICLE
jgi:hypothetical protein